jgi:hypothetical protein
MSPARKIVRGAAFVLLVLLAVAAGSGFLEAGVCWDAFMRCTEDPVVRAWWLSSGLYCLNGYVFCLKYIEGMEG